MKKSKVGKRRIKVVIELYNDNQVVIRYKKERFELPPERSKYLPNNIMILVGRIRKELKPVKGGDS